MNDINLSSKLFNFILYADDISLLSTSALIKKESCEEKMNTELGKISTWLCENKLSLNEGKTKCMRFRQKNKTVSFQNLHINGITIEYVETFTFLGITIFLSRFITFEL